MVADLSAYLEDPKDGSRITSLLNAAPLTHFSNDPGMLDPLRIRQSYCTLVFEICFLNNAAHSVSVIKDGKAHPVSRANAWTAQFRFSLSTDIEFHLIGVIVDGRFTLTIPIHVLHYRSFTCEDRSFIAPKWTSAQFAEEFDLWSSYIIKEPREQSLIDYQRKEIHKSVNVSDKDRWYSIHTLTARLGRLVYATSKKAFAEDFAKTEDTVLDVEGILDRIKVNPQLLEPAADGPFTINEKSYTTSAREWKSDSSQNLDLSGPALILCLCHAKLRTEIFPTGTLHIVEQLKQRLLALSSVKNSTSAQGIAKSFFERDMSSRIGRQLQHGLSRLLNLVMFTAARSSPNERAFQGLLDGLKDFELFEFSAYANVAFSLGYTEQVIKQRRSLLNTRRDWLLNVNFQDGESHLRRMLPGWRDMSIQPSKYKPDLIVFLEGSLPVIIDAKFRIGDSENDVCDSSGLKDIQAYLDEFQLGAAIVLVPAMPLSLSAGDGRLGKARITGSVRGVQRLIHIVEVHSGSMEFKKNFTDALTEFKAFAKLTT